MKKIKLARKKGNRTNETHLVTCSARVSQPRERKTKKTLCTYSSGRKPPGRKSTQTSTSCTYICPEMHFLKMFKIHRMEKTHELSVIVSSSVIVTCKIISHVCNFLYRMNMHRYFERKFTNNRRIHNRHWLGIRDAQTCAKVCF